MLLRKEELIEKKLDVYLDGALITGVEECDPSQGWVRTRVSRKPNSGLVANLCVKRRGKVELRAKPPKPPVEIGVVKPNAVPVSPVSRKPKESENEHKPTDGV